MKINKLISAMASAAAALAMLASCSKSLESTYNAQETKIDSYLTSLVSKNQATVVHNAGAHRAVLVEGEGEPLRVGGMISFYYAAYVFTGSISPSGLFATNHEETASASSWNASATTFEPEVMKLESANFLPGLYKGLQGVKSGEECVIVFSGKYGYGKESLGTIPANSALAYHIWVESINND